MFLFTAIVTVLPHATHCNNLPAGWCWRHRGKKDSPYQDGSEKKSPKAGKALTVGAGHAQPGSGMPEPYEGRLIGLCLLPNS